MLRLDPRLAPNQVAVLPLSRNEKLAPLAGEIADALRPHFMIDVDDAGLDRQALPPPGRGRHAVVRHDRLRLARRPRGHRARPRHDGAGAHPDRRPRRPTLRERLGARVSDPLMDDYYELLGVDADAPVDDIRAAYRDKKAAVADTGTDAGQGRRAPRSTRRGTCSPTRTSAAATTSSAPTPTTSTTTTTTATTTTTTRPAKAAPARRSTRSRTRRADTRRRGARAARSRRSRCRRAWPSPRPARGASRCSSTSACCIVLFLGSQFLVISLEKSQHPAVYHDVSTVKKLITTAHDKTSAANKQDVGSRQDLRRPREGEGCERRGDAGRGRSREAVRRRGQGRDQTPRRSSTTGSPRTSRPSRRSRT